MSFIDELTLEAHAGDGGSGVVRFLREKYRPRGGPCGGDGGKGGDVVVRAVRDSELLRRLTDKQLYKAARGEDGGSQSKHGADGEDLTIDLPLGSTIENMSTHARHELTKEGQTIVVLSGGTGGKGNEHFKNSTNQRPMESTPGVKGEQAIFHIELALIADVGFVGLPNAGKTSLLNALAKTDAKVGAYEFTTIDPNLGVYHGYVIADIPGLIEGASEGKGLGHKFLKHVQRTRLLLHCISLERDSVEKDYSVVRKELSARPQVASLPEFIVLTKSDAVDEETLQRALEITGKFGTILGFVSILDDGSLKELGDKLTARLSH